MNTHPNVGEPTAGPSSRLAQLTPREVDVLRVAAEGRTNVQVAGELGITVHCVKFHLASIFRKLGVHNRTEAAVAFLTLAGPGSAEV